LGRISFIPRCLFCSAAGQSFSILTARQQVKWLFPSGNPGRLRLLAYSRASITFEAEAILGGPAKHYNNAWIESTNIMVSKEQLSPADLHFHQYRSASCASRDRSSASWRATVTARLWACSNCS